jgi:uncharacterized protein (TIGR02453 family)
MNRPRYEAAKENFIELVTFTLKELAKVDPDLAGLEPKSTLFRINRDIRFSHNKNPYKTSLSAAFAKGGRKAPNACYYMHIESGNSIVYAGIHDPSPQMLAKIRAEIAADPEGLKTAISNQQITKQYSLYLK